MIIQNSERSMNPKTLEKKNISVQVLKSEKKVIQKKTEIKKREQMLQQPSQEIIKCFNCFEVMGYYKSANNSKVKEGLQIHICLTCKLSGINVEIFTVNKEGTKVYLH